MTTIWLTAWRDGSGREWVGPNLQYRTREAAERAASRCRLVVEGRLVGEMPAPDSISAAIGWWLVRIGGTVARLGYRLAGEWRP